MAPFQNGALSILNFTDSLGGGTSFYIPIASIWLMTTRWISLVPS